MRNNEIYRTILFAVILLCGCKKLAEVAPPATSINSGNVYTNDASAIAAVTNIYASISKAEILSGGIASLSLYSALSADELSIYPGSNARVIDYFYRNALSVDNLNNPDFWTSLYRTIYYANAAMEGLSASATLTFSIQQQLLGEVKFMRAFCYFYLANLYGDVPLILTTDYKVNAGPARTAKDKVYDQIVLDLKDAQNLLSSNYLDATLIKTTGEKVRPTKWVAKALLARVFLYTNDFVGAETESSTIINSSLFSLCSLIDVFKMNSKEAIWQLQPVNAGWNTETAKLFVLPPNGPNSTFNSFYLSNQLLVSFEANDQRKANWINSVAVGSNTYYYPVKYKSATYNAPVTEYEMVFRLAEQYLIRAEARAQQNNLNGAKDDLLQIHRRAGLPDASLTASDKASLLGAILHERQVEFFSEWGHRWLDLKRTGNVDAVMSVVTPQKGGTWNNNWQWYPISRSELLLNPNLVQNAGY